MSYNSERRDKVLTRYLLNDLSQFDVEELENEMLLDDELFHRLQVVEMILIDSYVRNESTAAERERFEDRFLVTPANRAKAKDSEMFHESLQQLKSEGTLRWWLWNARFYSLLGEPKLTMALAAAALVLIVVGGWFLLERMRQGVDRDVPKVEAINPNKKPVAPPSNVNPGTSGEGPARKGSDETVNDRPAKVPRPENRHGVIHPAVTLPILLSPSRGGTDMISIPKHGRPLRIGVRLEEADIRNRRRYSVYVEIKETGERYPDPPKDVIISTDLNASRDIILDIPAGKLKNGGKYLFVLGNGRSLPFQLRKEGAVQRSSHPTAVVP